MKTVIALLFACLVALPARAVDPWDNWMSLLQEPASTAYDYNCLYVQNNSFITLTLWLVRPVNPDFDGAERAVEHVSYFDVKITMTEGLNPTGWALTAPGFLVEQNGSLLGSFDAPQPVVDERVALATCEVFVGGMSFEIPEQPWARCVYNINASATLSPVVSGEVPGSVCYVDADDPIDGRVVPTINPVDDHVFAIVESTVPVSTSTWDAVKAIYR